MALRRRKREKLTFLQRFGRSTLDNRLEVGRWELRQKNGQGGYYDWDVISKGNLKFPEYQSVSYLKKVALRRAIYSTEFGQPIFESEPRSYRWHSYRVDYDYWAGLIKDVWRIELDTGIRQYVLTVYVYKPIKKMGR